MMELNKKGLKIGVAIFMILASAISVKAVFSDSGQLASSSTSTAISVDLDPDSLFQKLRNFISIDIKILNPQEMVRGIFSGFNENIRNISGVDIIKFFGFIAGLFSKAFSWLTQLLQNIKSG